MFALRCRRLTLVQRPFVQPAPSFCQLAQRFYRHSTWEPWEDEALANFVKHNGQKWTECTRHCLPHRSVGACYSRWTEKLDPMVRKGPLSQQEIDLLRKGVETYGEGQWRKIRNHVLPQRTANRLSNAWKVLGSCTSSAGPKKRRYTPEEDRLLLEGYAQYGTKWSKIQQRYLPHRNANSLATRYNDKLADGIHAHASSTTTAAAAAAASDPQSVRRWSEEEHDLLMRRTILYGQDWAKVAEGIPGRSAISCRRKWTQRLDPSIKSASERQWTDEETRILWRRLHAHGGEWAKVREALPGRNVEMCLYKMHKDLRRLRHVFGDEIDMRRDENRPEWRARIAGTMCNWIDTEPHVALDSASGALLLRRDMWTTAEINRLRNAAADSPPETDADWARVADAVGRPVDQCRDGLAKLTAAANHRHRVRWSDDENAKLADAVDRHGESWERVAQELPGRSMHSCQAHWTRLQHGPPAKQGRFSDDEVALLEEGVSMFGSSWTAIAKTYLPQRTPSQCANRWRALRHHRLQHTGNWAPEEDEALHFAVEQLHGNTDTGTDPPSALWLHIARMVPGRSISQCRARWLKVLKPGIKKGRWTVDEQIQLMDLANHSNTNSNDSDPAAQPTIDWKKVAEELGTGRTPWQCAIKHARLVRSGNQFGLR